MQIIAETTRSASRRHARRSGRRPGTHPWYTGAAARATVVASLRREEDILPVSGRSRLSNDRVTTRPDRNSRPADSSAQFHFEKNSRGASQEAAPVADGTEEMGSDERKRPTKSLNDDFDDARTGRRGSAKAVKRERASAGSARGRAPQPPAEIEVDDAPIEIDDDDDVFPDEDPDPVATVRPRDIRRTHRRAPIHPDTRPSSSSSPGVPTSHAVVQDARLTTRLPTLPTHAGSAVHVAARGPRDAA